MTTVTVVTVRRTTPANTVTTVTTDTKNPPVTFTPEETLAFLENNGIIDLRDVEDNMRKARKEKILKEHPYKIYQGKDDRWRTYLPDDSKSEGRRLIVKTNLEELETLLCQHYESIRADKFKDVCTLENLYPAWIEYKSVHVCETTVIRIKKDWRKYYENGGAFFLTRYATNLPSFIGVTGDDEWTTPNNCWGQNEDAAELCGGPWSFRIFDGQNDHPLWANLIAGDNPQEVYCTDAGYHITNSTAQYHIGTDWGGYDNHAAWEARTGGRILGVGGDGAVVAWEYLPHDGRGGIICIGSGCYDWYSYTFEAGYVENFHKNISIMTQNAFNYLTR